MMLVIDNYDSFTYNLVQYLGELGADLQVYRNDKITIDEIKKLKPEKILISPGPGYPKDAGISIPVIKEFAGKTPILGVCLGHQAIGEAFGGKIVQAKRFMHGKTSQIRHDGKTIFKGIPNPFTATRYHSLLIERSSLPECLEISAWTDQDEIMGVRHKEFKVEGIQFHPESILTTEGKKLLGNFLKL
jgi:anthranilate synthase/aminodeoxychorismate synthase-like glutamine amidotransferase